MGQGEYMGTGKVDGDTESAWGQGEYMGTGRVLMHDIGS